jgi:hypothetical protein
VYRLTYFRLLLTSTLAVATLSGVAVAQTAAEAPDPAATVPAAAVAAPEVTPVPETAEAAAPIAPADGAAPPGNSAPSEAPRTLLPWLDNFTIGGGLILYYYQPTKGPGKNNVSVFFANLLLDGKWDQFALHVEPRFRDSKLRSFFDGPAWLQEAYGSGTLGPVTIKVGKEYNLLGLFWDNSFYGNIQVYDGLKLDPNYGVSLEGHVAGAFGVDFAAQYFLVDGGSNVALANRDTLYIPGARRRNAIVGRVAPSFEFGAGKLQVGLSAEHFEADLPGGKNGVTRAAADVKLSYQRLGVWAEGLLQKGRHVTDFPYPGDPSSTPPTPGLSSGDNKYLLAGAEYGIGPVTLRYNLSYANYDDVDTTELMHVPAIGVQLQQHLGLLVEYVDWTRHSDAGDSDVDKSLNVTVNGHF